MIMENGRVRSWYKWVEENRQPATLRRPGKGEGSGIFLRSFETVSTSSMIYSSDDRG